ncbi:MAG: N-acetylmuramoyl-L-alanine amidase [Candidatus Marinimicrobia bacterium]|nr:N-acetylmuramoyl-L-alanine amidase [Candidatus Neomarinimicrobiota bacterium]MCF7921642.1 N-acetylmuramoyl-L-alanine amidase [Candidatus Neomarinimicrobiota bacterium]
MVITLLWSCAPQAETKITVAPQQTLPPLEIRTRADWGWVPLTDTIPTHEIKYITIHHGGEDFPEDKDVIKYLIGLQAWSRSDKNWIDNPYHYMIDLKGNIYEARPIEYPGDTNTDYDVRGHALICVMGNYENQILSETQFEQLARLTAYLADKYSVSNDLIKSHKDYTETLCPGADLYRYLEDGSLLKRVAELRKP